MIVFFHVQLSTEAVERVNEGRKLMENFLQQKKGEKNERGRRVAGNDRMRPALRILYCVTYYLYCLNTPSLYFE